MINLEKTFKKHFKCIEMENATLHSCCVCNENLSERSLYFDDKSKEFETEAKTLFDTDDLEYITSEDLEDNPSLAEIIWDKTILCECCYNKIGTKNSNGYNKFLDIIFTNHKDMEAKYKESMSEHQPTRGSGSETVINLVINSLYHPDYFVITLNNLGSLSIAEYNFIKDIVWEFGGISIDTMKFAANRKSKMIGQNYDISYDESKVLYDYHDDH